MPIRHSFTSAIADAGDATKVRPSNWNAHHLLGSAGVMTTDGSNNLVNIAAANEYTIFRRKLNAGANPVYEFADVPVRLASDFNFSLGSSSSLTGGGGAQTITFSFLPKGITSNSINKHYVRIVDGAASETVLIVGVSGTSITVSPVNNHTGGTYQVTSATGGIQEAIYFGENKVNILLPEGDTWIYGKVFLYPRSGRSITITGYGIYGTRLVRHSSYANGDILYYDNDIAPGVLNLSNFSILCALDGTEGLGAGFTNTSGAGIFLKGSATELTTIRNILIINAFIGVHFVHHRSTFYHCNVLHTQAYTLGFAPAASYGFYFTGGGLTEPSGGTLVDCSVINQQRNGANNITTGFLIDHVDGIAFIGCWTLHTKNGVIFNALPTRYIVNVYFTACVFDAFVTNAIRWQGTAVNNYSHFIFNGCHMFGEPAIDTNRTAVSIAGNPVSIQLTDCVIQNAERGGISIIDSPDNVLVTNCSLISTAIDRLEGQIHIAGTGHPKNIIISNNTFRNLFSIGISEWSLSITAPNITNLIIQGNNLGIAGTDYATAPLVFTSGTTNGVIIKDNVGLSDIIAVVPSGSSINRGFGEYIEVTGTTTIQTITPAWRGARFCMRSTAGVTLGTSGNIRKSRTLAVDDVVELIFDGSKWNAY